MSRTLDQIISDIRLQFKDTVLETAANNKGNLYSIIRAMALTCYNQEQIVQNVIDNKLVYSMKGDQLDFYGNNFNLIRRNGTSSFGFALIKSPSDTVLPINSVLQNTDGSLTFETSKAINIPKGKEIVVPIISISNRSAANLNSGNKLFSIQDTSLVITVGKFRDNNGLPIGSLSGASLSEDDETFRKRITSYINNKGSATEPIIKAIIQNYVNNVYFVEGRPAPGYTTIYIDTSNQLVIDEITSQVNNIKPLGTLTVIKSIQYQSIDIELQVILNSTVTDSITLITSNIKSAINNFFSTLSVGSTLYINELSNYITSSTGYYVIITKPTLNITPLISEYLLSPNEVNISVKSK